MTFDFWLSIACYIALMFLAVLYLDRRPSWRRDGRWLAVKARRISRSLFPPEEIAQDGRTREPLPVVRPFPPRPKGFARDHAGTVTSFQQRSQ